MARPTACAVASDDTSSAPRVTMMGTPGRAAAAIAPTCSPPCGTAVGRPRSLLSSESMHARPLVATERRTGASLRCHGTRYVQHARRWYMYGARTLRWAQEQAALRLWYVQHAGGWHAWPVRTVRRLQDVRVSLGAIPIASSSRLAGSASSRVPRGEARMSDATRTWTT
eukprot:scaffold10559_cov77-Phaeocystis_antarctica.AAC.3